LDNGPGISDSEADQLFDLYYRSADSPAAPGAGIGLFVCRGLVNAMSGRIWARHRPEGGAEFGFSLPVYAEQTVAVTAPVVLPASATASL
jgi:K+-sensing histidine kinase KdpD